MGIRTRGGHRNYPDKRFRGFRSYQGKPRGRPRGPLNPESGRIRIAVRDATVWRTAMEAAKILGWEFTWFVEAALKDLATKVRKRARSVEIVEAHMTRTRADRGHKLHESLRKLSGQPEPTDQDREAIHGHVIAWDEKFRGIAERLSNAGKQPVRRKQ